MAPSVVLQLLRHFYRLGRARLRVVARAGEEAEHGGECEDEGEGEPRAGEEAEHGEECEDESEGEPWEPKSE